jgi:hypothetical protein
MGTLQFCRIDIGDSRPAASVWKASADPQNIWAAKSIEVMQRKCDLGIKVAALSLNVLSSYACRFVEVRVEAYEGRFPLVEQRLFVANGKPWYAYIAMAENKTLLAEVAEFSSKKASRDEMRELCVERAAKWIRGCKRYEEHGKPILVDHLGRPLSFSSQIIPG